MKERSAYHHVFAEVKTQMLCMRACVLSGLEASHVPALITLPGAVPAILASWPYLCLVSSSFPVAPPITDAQWKGRMCPFRGSKSALMSSGLTVAVGYPFLTLY